MILDSESRIREFTQKGWWGTETVTDIFKKNAYQRPQAEALIDPPNRKTLAGGTPKRLTYEQMDEAVDNLALRLLELEVKKDDIIMVQLPNVVELAICYFAVARVGAIISPIPVQYRKHELRYTMGHLEPKVFVTVRNFNNFDYLQQALEVKNEMPFLRHLIVVGEDLPDQVISMEELLTEDTVSKYPAGYLDTHPYRQGANEIWTICWTSGTEASPKAVPRTHNQWLNIGQGLTSTPKLWYGDALLMPFPLINLAAISALFIPWLLCAGKLCLHHPFDPTMFVKQLEQEQINYTGGAPAILVTLAKQPGLLDSINTSALRVMGCGSAPPSPWLISEFWEKYGIQIFNLWGANEGTLMTNNADDIPDINERATLFLRWGDSRIRSSIWFAERVKTKLQDPETGELIEEAGKVGELLYYGPNIFPGYFKQPEKTEKAFDSEGYYKTGDLFSIEGENRDHYKFHGRLKDMIIRGGQNISPEEIENLVLGLPKIKDAAAIGVPDDRLGEKTCVYVVPKEGEGITIEEIVDFLKTKDIAVYKLPEILEIIDAIPRNPVGKILKDTLRKDYQQRHPM